jgi:rRNA maturation RNase YbeY
MEPPSTIRVSVLDSIQSGLPIPRIHEAVAVAITRQGFRSAEVTVLLTSDEHIAELNGRFRSIAESTDVLTFPEGLGADGEIAISVPFAERQAAFHGLKLLDEIILLAIHGALHLVGMDDESDSDREAMIAKMNEIARSIGAVPMNDWSSHHPVESTA